VEDEDDDEDDDDEDDDDDDDEVFTLFVLNKLFSQPAVVFPLGGAPKRAM